MKFLIDESVEYSLVLALRNLGYDVSSVVEQSPSIEDKDVLDLAYQEDRIIITNDKDFGELIYKFMFPHKGVILFRLRNEDKESKFKRLKILLEKYSSKIVVKFIVITDTAFRFKK
jgi:predicted nuclease of predicted toxin-antitoxin system